MKKPNILLITWHDAGQWFGCYGNRLVSTPNVDQLAAEGSVFVNSFSACAICSPSRAAIATGRYCQDNGVMFLTNTVNNCRLHLTERHFAKRLKDDFSYHTALFGVQHECAHEHLNDVLNCDEKFNTDPWPQASVSAECFETWVARRKESQQPFYAQIGFFESHLGSFFEQTDPPNYPYAFDDEKGYNIPSHLMDSAETRKVVGTLQGYLKRGDEALGRIFTALKENGLENDTLVVMCVDHGVGLPRAKTNCYDPGTSVAWIVKWPGHVKANHTVSAMVTQIDVLPTLFGVLGWKQPAEFQGQCFSEHLKGSADEELNDVVFSHMVETTRSVRTKRYKFIRNFREPKLYSQGPLDCALLYSPEARERFGFKIEAARDMGVFEGEKPHVELYDLEKDPNEFNNVSEHPEYKEIRDELNKKLWVFLYEHNDFLVNEPARTEWQKTTAQDAEAVLNSMAL
jgi:N-sulfoglucosamine sulfohydrolase